MAPFVDGRHAGAPIEEWVFAAWEEDATLGVVSGHRIVGRTAWYWSALARQGRPLLHITDFEVPVRAADPFIVKGEALWAEHTREAPMEQWSIGNETYASALDDPDEALGLAYGTPTPIAFDLEWYATGEACRLDDATTHGYEQPGVVHGRIEVLGEPAIEVAEIPARRWHRWTDPADRPTDPADPSTDQPDPSTDPADPSTDQPDPSTDQPDPADPSTDPADPPSELAPLTLPEAVAHTGVRAPFRFPDGSVSDWVLSPRGWRRRAPRPGRR